MEKSVNVNAIQHKRVLGLIGSSHRSHPATSEDNQWTQSQKASRLDCMCGLIKAIVLVFHRRRQEGTGCRQGPVFVRCLFTIVIAFLCASTEQCWSWLEALGIDSHPPPLPYFLLSLYSFVRSILPSFPVPARTLSIEGLHFFFLPPCTAAVV